ncbi:phosphotransferase enzyme family protein [Virgibacillus oceani]
MEAHIKKLLTNDIFAKCVETFGLKEDDVTKIGGFESFIYEYSRKYQNYILRITHQSHRTMSMMDAEVHFVNYLAAHGAHVCRPVPSVEGKWIECVDVGDSYFLVSSFEKAKGGHVKNEDLNPEIITEWGRVIGHFHALSINYEPQKGENKRHAWHDGALLTQAKDYLPHEERFIHEKMLNQMEQLYKLPKNQHTYGLIHADIHRGNFFVNNGKITVFDFDDCVYHWFVQDIAIALFYYKLHLKEEDQSEARAVQFLDLLMKGYTQENALDRFWLKQIPLFLKLREIELFIAIRRSFDKDNLSGWIERFVDKSMYTIEHDIPVLSEEVFHSISSF